MKTNFTILSFSITLLFLLFSCRSRSDVERGLDVNYQEWVSFKNETMKDFRAEEPKPWQKVFDETEWKGHLRINDVAAYKNNEIWVQQTYPKYFRKIKQFLAERIGTEPKKNFDEKYEHYHRLLAIEMRKSIDYNMKKVRMKAQMNDFTSAMKKKLDSGMIQITRTIHSEMIENQTLLDEFNKCITKTNIMNFIEKYFSYEMRTAHSSLASDYKRLSRELCPLIFDYKHDYNTDDGYRLMALSALNDYTIYFFERSKQKFKKLTASQTFSDLYKQTNLITWRLNI